METQTNDDFIEIDKMSIDQAAGAFVMIAGAIGSLLLVIWQSKCHCKMNLCYIFQCERRPPNEEELKTLASQTKELKDFIFEAVIIFLNNDFNDSFFCIFGSPEMVCFVP